METRHRRRGGKSARAAASDPPFRPPSPVSESAVESGEEREPELADIGATGVKDRDPPITTLPGDAYQTPPTGAGAGTEGAHAEAPPSPVSLAQGGLATPGDGLSGPNVVGVDPAEAIATAEAQDPSAGPPGPQAVKVPSHPRVEQSDSIKTTHTHTLDPETTHTHTLAQPDQRTLTHVILFGNGDDGVIELRMFDKTIEQVSKKKYLGVWLDQQLDFSLHVDYAISKATLFDRREGISVSLGVQVYKSLVRPHLENADPVWTAASSKDLDKVQQTQVDCLRRLIGAKAHSSGSAIEVITGTISVKIRIRELCSREYLRIMRKDGGHCVKQLLSTTLRKGLRFCPLSYLSVLSKELSRHLDGCCLPVEANGSVVLTMTPAKVVLGSVLSIDSFGYHNCKKLTFR